MEAINTTAVYPDDGYGALTTNSDESIIEGLNCSEVVIVGLLIRQGPTGDDSVIFDRADEVTEIMEIEVENNAVGMTNAGDFIPLMRSLLGDDRHFNARTDTAGTFRADVLFQIYY